VVEVALRADLDWDQIAEAKRLESFQILDQDIREDGRKVWTFMVSSVSG